MNGNKAIVTITYTLLINVLINDKVMCIQLQEIAKINYY